MKNPNQIRFAILLAFIALVAISRVLVRTGDSFEWLSNFSPIGAMALFGGAYFKGWKAYALPLLALLFGDVFIAIVKDPSEVFYQGWYWVYGAFAIMVLAGSWIMQQKTVRNFLLGTAAVVLIHWIVTDFGVWLGGSMYPKTLNGFITCLIAAIPFERALLYGTLVFGTLMFGTFEWFKIRFPQLQYAA